MDWDVLRDHFSRFVLVRGFLSIKAPTLWGIGSHACIKPLIKSFLSLRASFSHALT